MRAAIFTEGSSTTTEIDDNLLYLDYFQGSFRSVKSLADNLDQIGTVSCHILSSDYGYVHGDEFVDQGSYKEEADAIERFAATLASDVPRLDVVAILLTRANFSRVVESQWDELVDSAKQGSTWYIGTSRSAIDSIDINRLRGKCDVVEYQRVGVARLDSTSREQLLESVKSKFSGIRTD